MKLLNKLKHWWNYKNCQICLGEGKLVKTGMFGDLIYKECPRCKGLGYYEPEWNDSVYRTSFLLLDQFKDGWKAINGEYYWCASDIMQTYRVKRKYNV